MEDKNIKIDLFLPRREGGVTRWGYDLQKSLQERGLEVRIYRGEFNVIRGLLFGKGNIIHTTVPLPRKPNGKKLILTLHGNFKGEKNIWSNLYSHTSLIADKITVVNPELRKILPSVRSADFIPISIKSTKYPPASTKKKKTKKNYNLLTTTNFNIKSKCFALLNLIEPLNEISKVCGFNLTILGNGKLLPDFRKKWLEKATFETRFEGFKDLDQYLKKSDLFIYKSGLDTGPYVLLDAMAHCLPILTNKIGVIDVFKKDMPINSVYENNKEFIDNFYCLLSEEKVRKEVIYLNTNFLKKHFDTNKVIDQYVDLYNSTLMS